MKLPLLDKGSLKINIFFVCFAMVVLIGFILFIQLGFGKCFIVAMWEMGWAGYWILSWIFIFYPLGILEFSVCFSQITIDEQGVRHCFGKLTLRNYSWDDIKRLEIWIFGKGKLANPCIIFSKTEKPHFLLMHNINDWFLRKHLVCLYKEGALELLQKYAKCPIYGLEKLYPDSIDDEY